MLRTVIFDKLQKEIEVQNAIEALLLGRGLNKGIEYIQILLFLNYHYALK